MRRPKGRSGAEKIWTDNTCGLSGSPEASCQHLWAVRTPHTQASGQHPNPHWRLQLGYCRGLTYTWSLPALKSRLPALYNPSPLCHVHSPYSPGDTGVPPAVPISRTTLLLEMPVLSHFQVTSTSAIRFGQAQSCCTGRDREALTYSDSSRVSVASA